MYKNILLLATTNVPNESELENVEIKSPLLNVLQIMPTTICHVKQLVII